MVNRGTGLRIGSSYGRLDGHPGVEQLRLGPGTAESGPLDGLSA